MPTHPLTSRKRFGCPTREPIPCHGPRGPRKAIQRDRYPPRPLILPRPGPYMALPGPTTAPGCAIYPHPRQPYRPWAIASCRPSQAPRPAARLRRPGPGHDPLLLRVHAWARDEEGAMGEFACDSVGGGTSRMLSKIGPGSFTSFTSPTPSKFRSHSLHQHRSAHCTCPRPLQGPLWPLPYHPVW